MSDAIEAMVDALKSKDFSSLGGVAKLNVSGEGTILIDSTGARAGDDEEADVTLTASLDTFRAIFDGNMNPTAAFMTGKLKLDGSMGMAMKLGSLLG